MFLNGGSLLGTPDAPSGPVAPAMGMGELATDPAADGLIPRFDVDMTGMDLDLDLAPMDSHGQNACARASFAPYAPQQQQQKEVPQLQQSSQPGDHSGVPNDASVPVSEMQDSSAMTGAGAGPLPTGFGAQSLGSVSGSTLTEFTKRRNWSQRLLEELRDFLHILTPDGTILYASPSCKALTGWEPSELVGRFVGEFIHPDDSDIFVQEFNQSIASGNPLRFFYRFRKKDPSWIIFESHGHPHLSNDTGAAFASTATINCRGFFMMARPYPTKNAALLDSFLEHKIENERLLKRIAELKREEQEEMEDEDGQWRRGDAYSSVASETVGPTESEGQAAAAYIAMPPPAKPGKPNTALTRQNLNEALAASKPDSITDKMARIDSNTHLETIEMLTGLRYRDGERSQGISTGDASPLLIRGDVGIQISLDREGRSSSDRKKKAKIADEYVCTDCGTLDSPEWRKGPNGPKTLCNACGLRWAKKEKKRQSDSQSRSQSQTGATQPPSLTVHSGTSSS